MGERHWWSASKRKFDLTLAGVAIPQPVVFPAYWPVEGLPFLFSEVKPDPIDHLMSEVLYSLLHAIITMSSDEAWTKS